MKRKLSLICAVCAVLILVLSSLTACSVPTDGSIKSITKPYIAEYECVEARLGNLDLLEKYDYITITLLEKSEMLVSFKPKNGEKKSFKGEYTVNPETREFTGTAGIFGARQGKGKNRKRLVYHNAYRTCHPLNFKIQNEIKIPRGNLRGVIVTPCRGRSYP